VNHSRDIVSFGLVKDIAAGSGAVTVVVERRPHTGEQERGASNGATSVMGCEVFLPNFLPF